MATHSSTLAWKIPWAVEPGKLQSMGHEESDISERLHFDFSLSCIGEGNVNLGLRLFIRFRKFLEIILSSIVSNPLLPSSGIPIIRMSPLPGSQL